MCALPSGVPPLSSASGRKRSFPRPPETPAFSEPSILHEPVAAARVAPDTMRETCQVWRLSTIIVVQWIQADQQKIVGASERKRASYFLKGRWLHAPGERAMVKHAAELRSEGAECVQHLDGTLVQPIFIMEILAPRLECDLLRRPQHQPFVDNAFEIRDSLHSLFLQLRQAEDAVCWAPDKDARRRRHLHTEAMRSHRKVGPAINEHGVQDTTMSC